MKTGEHLLNRKAASLCCNIKQVNTTIFSVHGKQIHENLQKEGPPIVSPEIFGGGPRSATSFPERTCPGIHFYEGSN